MFQEERGIYFPAVITDGRKQLSSKRSMTEGIMGGVLSRAKETRK